MLCAIPDARAGARSLGSCATVATSVDPPIGFEGNLKAHSRTPVGSGTSKGRGARAGARNARKPEGRSAAAGMEARTRGGGDRGAQPAARMLAVLEAVAEVDGPISAIDLVPRLGLPRATVHRIAVALERLGYLHREPGSKRFTVGFRQQHLALNTLINSSVRGARHAVLQALVDEVGETCNVTVLDGNEVVYIDRVESDWPLRTHLQPGSRIPIHCGASGMLFLSAMPAAGRRRILTAAPLRMYTPTTIVDPDRIELRLREIRATGVALEAEEFMQGLIGVAVPVHDDRGRICATVSMHAPTARFTIEEVRARVPALQRAAKAITQLIAPKAQATVRRSASSRASAVA